MNKVEFDIKSTLAKNDQEICRELESKNINLHVAVNRVLVDTEQLELPLLHVAALLGADDAIRAISQYAMRKYNGWDIVNTVAGERRYTALHLACKYGREGAVGILLRRRANPVITDAQGNGPLHYAAVHGSPAMINELLADGRELLLYAENEEKETPLHHLLDFTENADTAGPIAEAITFLLSKYETLPSEEHIALLPIAAKHGRAPATAQLIDKRADVHAPDENGKTAFLIAVQGDKPEHKQVIETLVTQVPPAQKEQMVNAKTPSGANALHLAAERNDPVLISYLRRVGVKTDVRLTTGKKETPLELATRKAFNECVHMLTLPLDKLPRTALTLSRRHSAENLRRSMDGTLGHSEPPASVSPPAQLALPPVGQMPEPRRSLPGSVRPFSNAALVAAKAAEQQEEDVTEQQSSSCGAFKLLEGLWRSLSGGAASVREDVAYTPLTQTKQMNGHTNGSK